MQPAANALLAIEVFIHKQSVYIVVLDAGSTGTRAHAFHYQRRVIMPTSQDFVAQKPLSLPTELFFVDRAPGVSSYHRDPDGLYFYLTELVLEVSQRLQKVDSDIVLSEVPLYFGATAGMRALSRNSSEECFRTVRAAFRSGPLSFSHPMQARVLSGEEEAAYGWLMVNYFHGKISADPGTTFGSLDMGGDSAEIAFIPEDVSIMADLFPMHFGPFPGAIHVYAHSFMGYGLIAASHRASALSSPHRSTVPRMPSLSSCTWIWSPACSGPCLCTAGRGGHPARAPLRWHGVRPAVALATHCGRGDAVRRRGVRRAHVRHAPYQEEGVPGQAAEGRQHVHRVALHFSRMGTH